MVRRHALDLAELDEPTFVGLRFCANLPGCGDCSYRNNDWVVSNQRETKPIFGNTGNMAPIVRDLDMFHPVSYTHLDVYKRQLPTRMAMQQVC